MCILKICVGKVDMSRLPEAPFLLLERDLNRHLPDDHPDHYPQDCLKSECLGQNSPQDHGEAKMGRGCLRDVFSEAVDQLSESHDVLSL